MTLLIALLVACGQAQDTASDLDPATIIDEHAAIVLSSSGGGGSTTEHFVAEHIEEDCPTDCADNEAPVLDAAVYLVDGVFRSSPPSIAGQRTAVIIAFSDPDCNLACGARTFSVSSPGMHGADISSLPSNLPCDSASSDVYLGFDLGKVEAGDHSFSLRVEDACGEESPFTNAVFEVEPE